MTIKYLIQKEFLQIRRNAFLPKIFVVLPIIMLLVVPYAANQEIRNLKFCVVDNDRSTMSRLLVDKLDASDYLALTSVEGGYGSALAQVEHGCADIILEIPHGFSSDVVRTGEAAVNVNANAVNGVKGALGQAYMLNVISDFASAQRAERGVGVGKGENGGVDVRPRFLFNALLDYKVFMVPGIIAMLLTLLIGYLPALNIVGEKEKGTIEQINVTPVSRRDFILSKLVPYWIIGLFMLLWSMLWARQRLAYNHVFPVVLPHRVEPRPDCLQLFFHHATGRPADVLLSHNIRPHERSAHADSQYAALGAGHDIRQPLALLHRDAARHLSERQHPGRPPAATRLDGRLRRRVVDRRDIELQKNKLISNKYIFHLSLCPLNSWPSAVCMVKDALSILHQSFTTLQKVKDGETCRAQSFTA